MQSCDMRGSVSQECVGPKTPSSTLPQPVLCVATNKTRGSKEHWETSAPSPDLLSKRTLLNGS